MGWNGSRQTSVAEPRKGVARKGPRIGAWVVLPFLLAVVAGGVLVMFCSREGEGHSRTAAGRRGLIREVEPAIPTNRVAVAAEPVAEEDERGKRREMLKAMSPEERLAFLKDQIRHIRLPENPSSNRTFRTAVEQRLAAIFTTEVGAKPPLMPTKLNLYDRLHLAEILISDNPVIGTDSERAKEAKDVVQQAKKEFMTFIREGGDPDEFIEYYHGQLVQAHDEWTMAWQTTMETIRKDPEIAPEYVKRVNERLAAKGIRRISVPKKMQEHFNIQIDDE